MYIDYKTASIFHGKSFLLKPSKLCPFTFYFNRNQPLLGIRSKRHNKSMQLLMNANQERRKIYRNNAIKQLAKINLSVLEKRKLWCIIAKQKHLKWNKKQNRFASMHLVAHKVGTPNIQIWDKKKKKHCLKICKIYTFFMLMKSTKYCWVYLKCKTIQKVT